MAKTKHSNGEQLWRRLAVCTICYVALQFANFAMYYQLVTEAAQIQVASYDPSNKLASNLAVQLMKDVGSDFSRIEVFLAVVFAVAFFVTLSAAFRRQKAG